MHPAQQRSCVDEGFSAAAQAAMRGQTAMPIVSAEVLGPDEINVGGVGAYTVVVANLGEVPVEHVHLNVSLPPGVQTKHMHPRPQSREGDLVRFDVGRLTPKSRQHVQIELISQERGPMELKVETVFSVAAAVATTVCQPELNIHVTGPAAVVVGDAATFKVVIENHGDGPAEEVAITQYTSDDPHAISGAAQVGRLAPGQTREIYLSAVTHQAGRLLARFVANAWGGLEVNAETEVHVARPRLAVEIGGPRVCAVQSSEVYTLALANPGDAPASNVEAVAAIPPGLHVVAFDRPVQFEAARRIVRWRVPSLAPGARETLRLKAAPLHADRFVLQVAAAADYGLRADAEHITEAAAGFSQRVA